LSALHTNREKYRVYYREITALLSFFCMPGVTYLAVHSEIVVRVALGEKWLTSAAILRVMAVSGFVWPLLGTCGMVMVTCGRTTRYFWWGIGSAITLAVSMLIGVHWGAYGVAVAYTAWTYITLLPSLWVSFHGTPVEIADAIGAAARAAVASVVMAGGLILLPAESSSPMLGFIWSLTAGTLFYLGAWCLLPGGRTELRRYASHARSLHVKRA